MPLININGLTHLQSVPLYFSETNRKIHQASCHTLRCTHIGFNDMQQDILELLGDGPAQVTLNLNEFLHLTHIEVAIHQAIERDQLPSVLDWLEDCLKTIGSIESPRLAAFTVCVLLVDTRQGFQQADRYGLHRDRWMVVAENPRWPHLESARIFGYSTHGRGSPYAPPKRLDTLEYRYPSHLSGRMGVELHISRFGVLVYALDGKSSW